MALNKLTLAEQLYQILRDDILTQTIPSGTKLTLKALQERFGVSSTPIREALTRLTNEGLVSYFSNVGITVVELDEEDIKDIFQLMGDLDALAMEYSVENGSKEKVEELLEENLLQSELKKADHKEWIRLSDEFHLIFYQYCNNQKLVGSAEKLRSQLSILSYQYQKERENQDHILEEHKEIYQYYKEGKLQEARKAMKDHLFHSMKYTLPV